MNGVDSLGLGQVASIERVASLQGDLNRQVLLNDILFTNAIMNRINLPLSLILDRPALCPGAHRYLYHCYSDKQYSLNM